jgi:hypothetical protein
MRDTGRQVATTAVIAFERITKGPVFGCTLCGQCVLHSTGLTCPMTCPKHLRNGPCGGVRADGGCEVVPGMRCVWLNAYERSRKLPWRGEFNELRPPIDHRLRGSSSWVNWLTRRDQHRPAGWAGEDE